MNSYAQTEVLAGQIFNPKNRFVEGRIISNSEGIIETLPIYVFPPETTSDKKLAVLSYMTAFGMSDDESPTRWATWTYSYICMCFETMPEYIRRENAREYIFKKFPVSVIETIWELSALSLGFEGSDDNREYITRLATLAFPRDFPEIPYTAEHFPEILAGCSVVPAVYGFCGLLIFMAGKKINTRNATSITEKRPQNLIDTYKIHEDASHFLIGDGKMQSQAHAMVNQAWVTYAFARKAIITDVAAFATGNSLPQRVVYTISKLLENVGMQSAYYIHRFLTAFPQAKDYACIRPALGVYAASIREVAKADSRIQPYYKVIHGDLTRAFHRNGILTLAAVAISFEKTTAPSMRNYVLGEGATMAVNMFEAEAASRNDQGLSAYTNVIEEGLPQE